MINREKHSRHSAAKRLTIWPALLIVLLIAAACSTGAQPSAAPADDASTRQIDVDALPTDLGRGLPLIDLSMADDATTGLKTGDIPPDFRLQLEDGEYLSLRSLQGRPVMINFWATWCGPCRLEMPDIVEAAAENEDLVVLAVNVQEDLDRIRPFVEEFQMAMPVARDSDGEMRKLYEVRGMPTSIFIDRDGLISARWDGLLTADLLNDLLAEIL